LTSLCFFTDKVCPVRVMFLLFQRDSLCYAFASGSTSFYLALALMSVKDYLKEIWIPQLRLKAGHILIYKRAHVCASQQRGPTKGSSRFSSFPFLSFLARRLSIFPIPRKEHGLLLVKGHHIRYVVYILRKMFPSFKDIKSPPYPFSS
jgi:hypothetical protein